MHDFFKKNIRFTVFFTLAFSFVSCTMQQKADKIFYNGTVYTVNHNFEVVEAFAVRNGLIIGSGTSKSILHDFDAGEKIDLHGKPVYPGFIDAHCHFFGYGSDLVKCDLYGTTSFEDVLHRVAVYAKTNKFEWILGRGWDQNDWDVKEFSSKEKLD